jgi:hypothetical protein
MRGSQHPQAVRLFLLEKQAISEYESKRLAVRATLRYLPLHRMSAPVKSLRIRPIRDTSRTTPDPMNTAQTSIALAKTSGAESVPKLGVKAAAIGA